MTRLYIIRHGETEWNKEKRTQGCGNDLPLSQLGRKQAQMLGKVFRNIDVGAIYSSDLKRAYETALEISKTASTDINVTSKLREMNFGCWEGLTIDEIKSHYGSIYEVWRERAADAIIPNGERLIDLQKRVLSAVGEILSQHAGENIVIVSHGISVKILILSILGMDISLHSRIRLDNTGVSIIDYYDDIPVLIQLNDICHLKQEGVL